VATGLLGALVPIEILGHMTSIGTLLAFIIVCAGVIMLRKSHPELKRSYRVPFVPAIPLAGILVCVTMMASLERMTWIRLVAWLAIGLLIFFGYSRAHSKIARQLGASVAGGKAQPKPAQ
jgi:APA family basic amino acid/polyamine antiporter